MHRAEQLVSRGVGGFILFGGTGNSVRELTSKLRAAAAHPLLIGSDLERGAGQQLADATSLPPAAAIAALDSPNLTRTAGRITAAEAREVGINWVLAPVADLDVEPRNPIVSTRAFGSDPEQVATHVAAWTEGCHEGGALACAKHFPGHGRTIGDSHLIKTVVEAARDLLEQDLIPFRAAFSAGVDSIMTAHVAYPALDESGTVATHSPLILKDLLRGEMDFRGLIVSDALGMKGLSEGMDEGEAAVRALRAGCDLLLYPGDEDTVLTRLRQAESNGELLPEMLDASLERLREALSRVEGSFGVVGDGEAASWAETAAQAALLLLRGEPRTGRSTDLIEIDDDAGGPHPTPSREALREALNRGDVALHAGSADALVAVYADPRAWKGRAGLSDDALSRIRRVLADRPTATVILFGHPRLADQIPSARNVLCAWGGEPLMQRAAGSSLAWRRSEEGP